LQNAEQDFYLDSVSSFGV